MEYLIKSYNKPVIELSLTEWTCDYYPVFLEQTNSILCTIYTEKL